MERVKRLNPSLEWSDLSVILVDDAGIAAIHRRVFGGKEATDVISLLYHPAPHEGGGCSAEVVVNVQRARKEGLRRSRRGGVWNACRELALYLAHGCDHLSGADDADNAQRTRMRRRELRWIKEEALAGAVDRLIDAAR